MEPKCKQSRREGMRLFGNNYNTKKNYPPGLHGPKGFTKQTDYGIRLREKQKAKRMYHVTERQMKRYFDRAFSMEHDTGVMLSLLLEQRLDNVVYRLGFAKTRAAARQLINHRYFTVNGKRMDIPSYQVSANDVIEVKESKKQRAIWKEWPAPNVKDEIPGWLDLDPEVKKAKVLHVPADQELHQGLDMNLIIEYYSR